MKNYNEDKKVALACLEFEDYTNLWWEQVQNARQDRGDPPISTWEEMKNHLRSRFVPNHYKRDLFNNITTINQGFKSVEEYFKEMELAMIRANVQEQPEQTMARFLLGLNNPIRKITEF